MKRKLTDEQTDEEVETKKIRKDDDEEAPEEEKPLEATPVDKIQDDDKDEDTPKEVAPEETESSETGKLYYIYLLLLFSATPPDAVEVTETTSKPVDEVLVADD